MIRVVHSGSESRIRILIFYPYPGSWGLKKHRIRIRNTVLFYLTSAPDPFCSRDPSGMGEISGSGSRSGSGMNNPDHISESLEQFFGLKTT
jgi:hypothetical protein